MGRRGHRDHIVRTVVPAEYLFISAGYVYSPGLKGHLICMIEAFFGKHHVFSLECQMPYIGNEFGLIRSIYGIRKIDQHVQLSYDILVQVELITGYHRDLSDHFRRIKPLSVFIHKRTRSPKKLSAQFCCLIDLVVKISVLFSLSRITHNIVKRIYVQAGGKRKTAEL